MIIDVLSHAVVTQSNVIHKCPIYKGLWFCSSL
nr:MAG TPA: Protein of unknown function (DUF1091) [Bacteriophage sp.]